MTLVSGLTGRSILVLSVGLAWWLSGCLLPVAVECFCGGFRVAGLSGRSGRAIFVTVVFAMVGSLTIAYRRKRNVGGRVLRNIARCSTDTLADTFREKMLHASFRIMIAERLAVLGASGCKVYICSRRFKRILGFGLDPKRDQYSQYQIFNLRV